MLHQKPSGTLARLKYLAALPVCAGLLCASTLAFSKSYGWIDLIPKPKDDSAYTRKTADDNEHANSRALTHTKGHKTQKKTTLYNSKLNKTATITDKNSEILVYNSKKTTTSQGKILSETYGDKFPKTTSSDTLSSVPAVPSKIAPKPPVRPKLPRTKNISPPPVPPAAPVSAVPPVPPVGKSVHINAPKPPAEIIMNQPDSSNVNLNGKAVKPVSQLFVINGTPYRVKTYLRPGEHVYVSGQNSAVYYTRGDGYAKSKWGTQADSGVVVLSGKPTITVK